MVFWLTLVLTEGWAKATEYFGRRLKGGFKGYNMGYALFVVVYDFTPIYSQLWQSVAIALGYPACRTATPH